MSRNPHLIGVVGRARESLSSLDKSSAGSRFMNVFFIIMITTAFVMGLYSLFLAYANAGKFQPLSTEGMLRTATAADAVKIDIAIGVLTDQDLVYVVLDSPEFGLNPDVEIAAGKAALVLADSGLTVSVRLLNPEDPDFTTIVAQNGITHFPTVLAVKKDGGIVLLTDDLNEMKLLQAYYAVWGKTSSCEEAGSAIY